MNSLIINSLSYGAMTIMLAFTTLAIWAFCPELPKPEEDNNDALLKYAFCKIIHTIFLLILLLSTLVCAGLFIYTLKQEHAQRMSVIEEYKADGYIICTDDSGTKYAVSADELKKYKEKSAKNIILYTVSDKEEAVKKASNLELTLTDTKGLYSKSDCYDCSLCYEITKGLYNRDRCYITKEEYDRYKVGESFYMTVFYENKNHAELISTDIIDTIQIID